MSSYSESKFISQFQIDLRDKAIFLNSATQQFSNASGVIYTNSANLYILYTNAITTLVQGGVTYYSLKSGLSPTMSITAYLASLSSAPAPSPAPTPSPAPVVHSSLIYLGDYVTVNSSTNTVSCGSAKLTSISDAVNDQDAPSYKQVKAVQTSLNSSLASTNANVTTVTNQVADIVAGSTITKFKTLVDTINALTETEHADVANAVTTLSQKIDDEKARAQDAESSLSSSLTAENLRAVAAENALTSSVSDEKTRAETAEALLRTNLTSEVSRATSSEAILASKEIMTSNILPTAGFCGGADAPLPIPASVYAPFDGYYYTNSGTGTNKMNWYMPAPALTFGDIQYCSFNISLLSNAQVPYIVIYSQPKKDGTDKGSWYNARYDYEVQTPTSVPVNNPATNPTPYQFYCAVSGSNIANMPTFGFQLQPMTLDPSPFTVGTMLPTDKILYVSIQTNSAASANQENFIVENFAITTKLQTYNYNFSQASLANAVVTASLNSEVQRALAKEADLLASLNAQISKESGDIASLNGSLSQLSITLNGAIGTEKTRAEGIENSLKSQIDGINTNITSVNGSVSSSLSTLTTNLQSEVSNRTLADSNLTTRIANVEQTLISFLQHYFGNSTYSSSSQFPITFPNAHA